MDRMVRYHSHLQLLRIGIGNIHGKMLFSYRHSRQLLRKHADHIIYCGNHYNKLDNSPDNHYDHDNFDNHHSLPMH